VSNGWSLAILVNWSIGIDYLHLLDHWVEMMY
jgi:hypothetical protein